MLAPSLVEADRSLLAARALGPLIAAHRDAIEEQRRLPAPLVEALVEADLFRLWVPREVGGAEASLETLLRVVEEVSKHDGAVGWNLAIGASGALVSGWLDAETLREVFGSPASIVAGSFNVRGKAAGVRTPGGYQVSGQWGFGSGCQQAKWLGGAGAVVENGAPRMLPDGVTPEPFMFLFPQAKAELLDTWKVMGMRGTGSQDYRVNALAIPEGHAIPLARPPRQSGPLYRIPLVTLLGLALAPISLGIARSAIDVLVELAGAKKPSMATNLLRERNAVQAQVAKAEGLVRSARAFMLDAVGEVWREVTSGSPVTIQHRALLRLVATHVTQASAQAVDLMYDAGGATSFHQSCRLERLFRDVHVATQHAMVSTASLEPIGRVFLGMDVGLPRF